LKQKLKKLKKLKKKLTKKLKKPKKLRKRPKKLKKLRKKLRKKQKKRKNQNKKLWTVLNTPKMVFKSFSIYLIPTEITPCTTENGFSTLNFLTSIHNSLH